MMGQRQRFSQQQETVAVSACRLVRQRNGVIRADGDTNVWDDLFAMALAQWKVDHLPYWENEIREHEQALQAIVDQSSLWSRIIKRRLVARMLAMRGQLISRIRANIAKRDGHVPPAMRKTDLQTPTPGQLTGS